MIEEVEETDSSGDETTSLVKTDPKVEIYRNEILKALFAVAYFGMGLGFNGLALSILHDISGRRPHPDLVHSFVPQQFWAFLVADYTLTSVMVIMTTFAAFHRHRFIVFRRSFFIAGVVYIVRSIFMVSTVLSMSYSNNDQVCQLIDPSPITFWMPIIRVFTKIHPPTPASDSDESARMLCGDLMFSGHTGATCVCYLMILKYSTYSLWPLRWFMTLIMSMEIVFLSISRTHYVIDVVVAYWVAMGIFYLFHSFCETPHSQRRWSYHRNLVFYNISYWLEAKTPAGPLPKQVDWPLPWPKKITGLVQRWNEYDAEKHKKDKTS